MGSFTFKWPHHAEEVYVTGTFDNWTKSERLERVGQVFQKTVTLPESDAKIFYKFVVDGSWTTDHTAPQEKDHEGNNNNILLPDQMDKLEEASQAAAINNLVPESTTAQLAGAVPLEDKKEEAPAASSSAAILSSAAPDSTTAQLAAAAPLEDSKDNLSPPGGYPETPAAESKEELKVDPLPAAEGAVNPIKLEAGEQVPRDLTANAINSHVTLDKESYEQSDRIPGIETTLPPVTGNMIPESSLPILSANDPVIHTVTTESTTAVLAGQVPLEPKVPEIVKKSQEDAKAEPEASANIEEVTEKAAVEEELLDKVAEAPSTSEGTAGKGTEKSETDKSAVENAIAAATSAGEVALGAAITAVEAALPVATDAATHAGEVASDFAHKAGDAATDIASKATAAASDAATTVPAAVKGALPGAAQAEAEEKQKAAIDSVSPEVPVEVKESLRAAGESPEAAVNTAAVGEKKEYETELLEKVKPVEAVEALKAEEKLKAAIDNVSPEVPAEVKESLKEAGESPEAAVSTAAVEEKKEYETELLEKVKPTEAIGEASTKTSEEAKPKPVEEATALAVEPPQPVVAVKAVDEAKSVETPKPVETQPTGDLKLTDDIAPAVTALSVEPPNPVEAVKAVDVAPPADVATGSEEPPKPVEPVTAITAPAETEASEPVKVSDEPKAAVEHPASTEAAASTEATKAADEVHPAANGTNDANGTNGTAAAGSPESTSAADKAASEKRKKHRISGFFTKLKQKFA